MRSRKIFHYTDTLSVLGLLCVFAGAIVIVILSGANVYKRIAERDIRAYEIRTTSMYLTTKIRSADTADNVEVEDVNGQKTLVIHDIFEDSHFCTYIYFHDGYLKEAYLMQSAQFTPESGQKLVKADSVSFDMQGNLVKAVVDLNNGGPIDIAVCVNGKGDA